MKKQRERKILFHIDSVIAAEVYIYTFDFCYNRGSDSHIKVYVY